MRKTALILIATFALLGAAVAVYAASLRPAVGLGLSPRKQTVTRGNTVRFKLRLDRRHGFDRRVALYVRGLPAGARGTWILPAGATLPRAYTRGPTVIVPAQRTTAILVVRTSTRTRLGDFRPMIKVYGARVRDTRFLRLIVKPRRQAPQQRAPRPITAASPAPTLTLTASSDRSVLQGEDTTYDVALTRDGGFGAPVGLAVTGLPSGATAAWSPSSPVAGDTARLTVSSAPSTPVGSYELTITGTGGGLSSSALAILNVKQTKPFGMSGSLAAPLLPGTGAPLDVTFTNPYDFNLTVTRIDAAVADATSNPGCSGAANYGVTPYSGPYPLILPPGTTQLSSLVADSTLWPRAAMLDLPTSQDACKGVAIRLDYTGVAGR
jgi:hypothetical protein